MPTSLFTREVSASSRKKLVEIAATNAERQQRADEQSARAQSAEIEAVQGRYRDALWSELGKHPDGQAIRSEFDNAVMAFRELVSRKPDRKTLQKGLATLQKTLDGIDKGHRSAVLNASKRAIDQDKYFEAMLKAIKRKPDKLRKGRHGALKITFKPEWQIPVLRFPPQTSFTLIAPFDHDADVTEQFSALLGLGGQPTADDSTGLVDIQSLASAAGYQMERAQLGAFLTIPSGFSTLTLQAKITQVFADVIAFAGGAAWASCGGIAEVTSLDNNSVIRRETSINSVVAPVLFYARDIFNGPHVINAEFPISHNGGDILVTAGLKGDAWGAGLADALASADGTVSKITIKIS
jgi:hypothetical protein